MKKILFFIFSFHLFNLSAFSQENAMQMMAKANAKVAKATAHNTHWDGPVDGPKIVPKKRVIFIAGDLSNSATYGAFEGAREAAMAVGWEVLSINCSGACYQGEPIIYQAFKMNANAIILAGIEASTQSAGLAKAQAAKIPVIGWRAASKSTLVEGLFANLGSHPRDIAQLAALFTATEANSKMGIVILSDNSTAYLSVKSAELIDSIKQCESCHLLEVVDIPIMEAHKKLDAVIDNLHKRYGDKWTHIVTVSDLYFDVIEKLPAAQILVTNKIKGIAAGDGSVSAYQRIRSNRLQIGTVAEAAHLEGWQLIDELNRAFNGAIYTGYLPALHVTVEQNISFDGGSQNHFEPENDYKNYYKRIWLK